jgi:flagellar motor switch protein FliN/FliY
VASNIESILKLEVPVIVQIAHRTMSVEEVVGIAPGAIIELPKLADDDLEILVNNKPVGTGHAVKVGENFGVRVSYVGDLTQRIAAMAAAEEADAEPRNPGGATDAEPGAG